ncbi:hypothetical protein GOV12_04645 [Candidatus Pacearchaeota archaeon]|nr:hypothetical protein [Candidatus Pacearchaeota archaeon]
MKKKWNLAILVIFLIILVNTLFISAGTLKVTNEHPFLINNQWIDASDLVVGDLIKTINGKLAKITNIKDISLKNPTKVYNLEASIFHDFVVGKDQLIVHNSDFPNFDYPPVDLQIEAKIAKDMLKKGKKVPSNDEFISRGFIDKDHYLTGLRQGVDTQGNPILGPQYSYGKTDFNQWKDAYLYLDGRSKGVLKGTCDLSFDETLLREVGRRLPAQTESSIVGREVSIYEMRFRINNVLLPGQGRFHSNGFQIYSQESVNIFNNNKFMRVSTKKLSENPDVLNGLKKQFPHEAAFIDANANNLYYGYVKYPPYDEVPGLLRELLKKYNARITKATTPEEIITVAADFQKDFVSIHPFSDGNGRISRLLMDYILKSKGLPPAHLNKVREISKTYEVWREEVLQGIINAMKNYRCVKN